MELELDDVSLRETLETGLTMHAERAARDGVALGLRLEPEEISVRADERKIRQVVFNLLSNAVKLTPPAGASTSSPSARPTGSRWPSRTRARGSRPRTRS